MSREPAELKLCAKTAQGCNWCVHTQKLGTLQLGWPWMTMDDHGWPQPRGPQTAFPQAEPPCWWNGIRTACLILSDSLFPLGFLNVFAGQFFEDHPRPSKFVSSNEWIPILHSQIWSAQRTVAQKKDGHCSNVGYVGTLPTKTWSGWLLHAANRRYVYKLWSLGCRSSQNSWK